MKRVPVLRKARAAWPVLFIAAILSACSPEEPATTPPAPIASTKNAYAGYFKIYRHDNYSRLVTWLNADRTDSAVYILYRREKPVLGQGVFYMSTPISDVACLGSVFVGFLNRLNALDRVIAVDNLDFISNRFVLRNMPPLQELAKNGQLNLEQALTAGVKVMISNPGADRKTDFDMRLLAAGIMPLVCADYFENHPLGRAEWIKVFGLLLNKETEADSLFAITEQRYLSLKRIVDTCKYKPTVFTEIKTSDTWFVAGGESSLARLLADAGADYLWKDNGKTGVTALNMEQVLHTALQADYWLHQHLCNSKADLLKLDRRYAEFKAFRDGNIFNNNARTNGKGANPYWEEGLCEPDKILDDLVQIFHPTLYGKRRLNYYQELK